MARRAVASLRRRWQLRVLDRQLRALDRQLERHRRQTLREIRRQIGPYARRGDGLASMFRRIPVDEHAAVSELLRCVDLGPGGPDVDIADRFYDLIDRCARR